MPNARFNERKAAQKGGDGSYEGESGPSSDRDNAGKFQPRESVNKMQGTGARQPDQAEYTVPKDNWRSK